MSMLQVKTLNGQTAEIDQETLTAFMTAVRGPVLTASSPDYELVRPVWNKMIDKCPALIVRCSGTADVVTAVNFARQHNILLAVRGGGHNAAGNATCDGGLMIDLSLMRGIHVDPKNRVAHVQGGATWGDLDHETQLHGLAAPGGVVSTTGVAGLTLGGGYGWLRRKHGLSCDNMISAEVVTAEGQVLTASEDENPDLLWALRGGGGNFGVITSFEFQLHPVGPIVNFVGTMYALEEIDTILPAWRDFMMQAPPEYSSNCFCWTIPDADAFPPEVRNRHVIGLPGVHIGPLDEGAAFVQPLRELATPVLDLSGQYPFTAVQSLLDWAFPKNEHYHYWKSLYLNELSADVIAIIKEETAKRPTNNIMFDLWAMGGAVSQIPADGTAMGDRSASFTAVFNTTWVDPADGEASIEWTRNLYNRLQPYSSGGSYLNFPGFMEEKNLVEKAFGRNYNRLAQIKAKYDPQNLFSLNQNIKPATG